VFLTQNPVGRRFTLRYYNANVFITYSLSPPASFLDVPPFLIFVDVAKWSGMTNS
jgi:hypothetical protein